MVGWHHQFNVRELEQTPGDGEGQGCLACCSPWDCKELDKTWLVTEQQQQKLKQKKEKRTMNEKQFNNSNTFIITAFAQLFLQIFLQISAQASLEMPLRVPW